MAFDHKLHYKMYKDGKKWVFAALSVTFLSGAGIVVENNSTSVKADTTSAISAVSSSNSNSNSESSSSVAVDKVSNSDKTDVSLADSASQESSSSSITNSSVATQAEKTSSIASDNQPKEVASSAAEKTSESNSSADTSKAESTVSSESENNQVSSKSMSQTASQAEMISSSSTAATANSVQTFSAQTDSIQTAATSIDTDNYLKSLGIDVKSLNTNSVLKLASLFHIFANQANFGADVNGNVAIGVLKSTVDFGTRNESDNLTSGDIYYIQELGTALESSSFRNTSFNHVVLGKDVNVSINGDQVLLDGVVMTNLKADDVYQDTNVNTYIDFAQVFEELSANSTEYATHQNSNGVIENFEDMNNRYVDVSKATADAGSVYVNIPFEYLSASQSITIKGVSSSIDGPTIVINVTDIPTGSQSISTQIELDYSDGTSGLSSGEAHSEPNHILWNLGTSDQTFNFSGGRFMGSILAPNATINAGVNIDGNIVAKNVNITGGESHRWDIHPNQPTQPTQPTQASQPTQPTQASQPTQPTQASQPTQATQASQPTQTDRLSMKFSSIGSSTDTTTKEANSRKALPQTGQDNQSSMSLIGVVLLALSSIISWLGFSRKKNY
jgi:choice-of-anchor A domain-containing protein/LPXTG-motif cell wall-anchored protein